MADLRHGTRTKHGARDGLDATVTTFFAITLFLMSTVAGATPLPDGPSGATPPHAAVPDPAQAPEPPFPGSPESATTQAATINLMAPGTGAPATPAELEISPPASGLRQQRGPDTPIFEKWWFWTAITAVAVTTVVIVATSSGPSAPRTDLGNMVAF